MLLLACYYCTQKWREEEEERVILKHAQSLLPVDIFCYAEGPGIVAHHWASPREAVVSFSARDNAGLNCCVGIRPPVFTQHRRRACAPKKPVYWADCSGVPTNYRSLVWNVIYWRSAASPACALKTSACLLVRPRSCIAERWRFPPPRRGQNVERHRHKSDWPGQWLSE